MTATAQPLSSASLPASEADPRPLSVWIWNPWLDLLVGCGAWSAPLLFVAYISTQSHTQQWSFAFYLLALVFNYPHFMATVYRAYHTREQFQKYRIFTIHIALLLAAAGVVVHFSPALLPWLFTLYIFWSPWHYSGQNFGLLMMFARRGGIAPERLERHALYSAFIASYVLLMLNFHTGPSADELILSLNIPARITLWPRVACAVWFLGAGGWALFRFARRSTSWRVLVAPFTLFLSQFLWFVAFVVLDVTTHLQVQQTRYSTGMLAVLHSTQYLWITSYYQRREARATGQTNWRFAGYFVTLIAGGIALFIPGPWIVSRLLRADFTASFLTFTALVNIHHFILDGAIWKLRDSRIASLLIDSRDKASAGAPQAVSASPARSVWNAFSWLAGDARGAHWTRVAVAVLLCAWGLMDQARYFWLTVDGGTAGLERAVKLNPYDSMLLLRIARANQKAGDNPHAITALIRAVQLNPHNRSLRLSLARALLTSGRYAEADQVYRDLLSGYPNEVEALINDGLLAQRLGRPDEAIDDWRRALDLDASQGNAQLYLGDALGARGEDQAAARHYRAFLQLVAAHPEQHAGDSRIQLTALIKVADADARVQHATDAALEYDSAVVLADRQHDAMMGSLALMHRAEFEDSQGHARAALLSYQRALALDAGLKEAPAVAADWAEYGQFLHRHGQPEQLSYACFLHAEALLQRTPGERLEAAKQLRAASEYLLGRDAAAVRSNLDAFLKRAANLPAEALPQ